MLTNYARSIVAAASRTVKVSRPVLPDPTVTGPARPTEASCRRPAGLFNTFVADLSGLADGVTHAIGVRSFNASGEEANPRSLSATADARGRGRWTARVLPPSCDSVVSRRPAP
jgi:hypothetical protein